MAGALVDQREIAGRVDLPDHLDIAGMLQRRIDDLDRYRLDQELVEILIFDLPDRIDEKIVGLLFQGRIFLLIDLLQPQPQEDQQQPEAAGDQEKRESVVDLRLHFRLKIRTLSLTAPAS